MRNIRTAAIASATAATLAIAGIAPASAEANNEPTEQKLNAKQEAAKKAEEVKKAKEEAAKKAEEVKKAKEEAKKAEEEAKKAAKAANKPVIFVGQQDGDKAIGDVIKDSASGPGSSKAVNDADQPFFIQDAFGDKTNPGLVPQWARIWIDSAVIAGIGALVGLIIAGFNFASYNGWINF